MPELKKRLADFFLDESGSSAKKGLVYMGLLSFALSATPVLGSTKIWERSQIDDDGRCVGFNDGNTMVITNLHFTHGGSDCVSSRGVTLQFKFQDFVKTKALTRGIPDDHYVPININTDELAGFTCEVSDHLYTCCAGNHFNSGGELLYGENDEDIEDLGPIYWHKNDLEVEEVKESGSLGLQAKHHHDVIDAEFKAVRCHASDHYSSGCDGSHGSNGITTSSANEYCYTD
ncbi:TPA: hypothetical protein HA265_07345 [Candidatus Woesearchaeota archaeon]|nr:hypothetical protein [Candidatus Woesearchaeota archaeon]